MHEWQATPIRDAIVRCLQEHGPMTSEAVAKTLQMPVNSVRRSIEAARKAHGAGLLRIAGWVTVPRHKVPVYDVQRGRTRADVKKPPPTPGAERQRRYTDKHYGRLQVTRRAKAGVRATPWSGL